MCHSIQPTLSQNQEIHMTTTMFGRGEDIYDGNKIEEIQLNCPWTITVPSGTNHDYKITKNQMFISPSILANS